MARSSNTYSALDELRQIQSECRGAVSLDDLRKLFDRVQAVRHARPDEFETQLLVAEVQEEIISRARALHSGSAPAFPASSPILTRPRRVEAPHDEVAEIPEDVPRIEPRTLRWAFYLAALFTAVLFAAFFYLVQTARKINLTPNEVASQQSATSTTSQTAARNGTSISAAPAATPVSAVPTLRLYTDLVPGTYALDNDPPQDLKDGEIILDNLQPGQHTIRVTGRSGNAAFTFDVPANGAPHVVGLPTASNAMAVLVSEQDGKAQLVTNASNSTVLLDGKPAGQVGPDGLELTDLGTTDHDLQVTQDRDRQRFVMTYTPAPVLTVYVKSDPNAGTVVVKTGQDGVSVYINGQLYRRQTDHGQVRIPLKVGEYTISVHKPGFIDPPPEDVDIHKAEEAAVDFKLDPAPKIATLDVKGALPGTMVYIDKNFAAMIGPDGNATISNVTPGDHAIELRRDQALPKRFVRTFKTGEVITLSGVDATLDKVVTENKPAPPPPAPTPADTNTAPVTTEIQGAAVRRVGGAEFVPYHTPKTAGHYSFQAQAHVGGFFKHGKLQWYAGYQDPENYVLFTLDGKHAMVHEVRNGRSVEVDKTPFNVESNQWVQVDLSVKPNSVSARAKTPDGQWTDIGTVTSSTRDFTQGKVGFYTPGNNEAEVSGFRFSNH